jgi:hypothetical protein
MRLIERQETIEPMKKERKLEILLLQLTTRYVNRREMKIHRCFSHLLYSNMSNFLLQWTDRMNDIEGIDQFYFDDFIIITPSIVDN